VVEFHINPLIHKAELIQTASLNLALVQCLDVLNELQCTFEVKQLPIESRNEETEACLNFKLHKNRESFSVQSTAFQTFVDF